MDKKNENDKGDKEAKEQLLRELSENLNMDLGEPTDEIPANNKNDKGIKASLSTIPEASIEISCI